MNMVLWRRAYVIGGFSDCCKNDARRCGRVRVQACSFFPPGLRVQQLGFSKPQRIPPISQIFQTPSFPLRPLSFAAGEHRRP